MKIQLTTNEENIEGYFWGSPANPSFHGNLEKLNDYCYNGQATEIYAPSILDYIDGHNVGRIIGVLSDLLGFGAKIVIGGTDPYILSKQLIERKLSVAEYNHIIFGQKIPVKGFHPLPFIKDIIQKSNIRILNIAVDYSETLYTIEGIRQ